MADAYKTLYRAQLPSTVATLYTAPTNVIIKNITVVNPDTVAHTFALYRNGTANANLMTAPLMQIPAGGFAEWNGTMALESGGTIAGVADTASQMTTIIDGDEVS